jgi:glycosyltransferase involved in cell wall biosynthesis
MKPPMPERPLVSVVIPTYNRRRWIGECLDSLRAQTYSHFEAIVVDDQSTDGTVEWLRSEARYAFARIHVQERNQGASEARNEGVRQAHGTLITFIDSDDLLEPTHLETAVATFQQVPSLGLFCCDARMIGPEGEILENGRSWHEINGSIQGYPVKTGLRPLHEIFLFSNCFPGFTLSREVYLQVGGLDQSIFPLDDYDLALRVAGHGYGVYYCHTPLARYRNHGGNCSGTGNALRVAREKLRCLRQACDRYPQLKSLGSALRHRLADIEVELGIAYAKTGQRSAAARSILKAMVRSPGQVPRLVSLAMGVLRR